MDDVKDKVKGFMKNVSNPFSSSSGKFKGQGRVLGSSSTEPGNPIYPRTSQGVKPNPSSVAAKRNPQPSAAPKSRPEINPNSNHDSSNLRDVSVENRNRTDGFDPYDSLVTTGKRSQNGYSLQVFECPICNLSFRTEEDVSVHVDSCVSNSSAHSNDDVHDGLSESPVKDVESCSQLDECIGAFLSGKPSDGSVEVILRLLRNVVKEPDNAKFRKIRMSNPKIKEAIGEVVGGIELLELVGFVLGEDGGELWAVMEVPSQEQISAIDKVISLLEKKETDALPLAAASNVKPENNEEVIPKKIDRQIRVFFSASESVASKIELPDSFYNLSIEEVKRESDMRKKKLAESQLLIPKSYKEKQAKAARKRYRRAIIRIQFPDGVVLQGVFAPWETTSALYEFVSSALKEPSLEFDLLHPVVIKRRVIPRFAVAGEKGVTLDEEDLVPSALVKFKPIETDSVPFTGICNELLLISEPLV